MWLPLLVFICLFLWLDRISTPNNKHRTLQIDLQQVKFESAPQKTIVPPKPKTDADIKPQAIPEPQPKPGIEQAQQTVEPLPQVKPITTEPDKQAKQVTPRISTGQILNQAKSYTDIQITDEFKAARPNTYQPQAYEVHDPYADIPYQTITPLATEMNFYSEGYRGDIERFFDAVILQKTFTTKYGTKINCALAVIVVCSWKWDW